MEQRGAHRRLSGIPGKVKSFLYLHIQLAKEKVSWNYSCFVHLTDHFQD